VRDVPIPSVPKGNWLTLGLQLAKHILQCKEQKGRIIRIAKCDFCERSFRCRKRKVHWVLSRVPQDAGEGLPPGPESSFSPMAGALSNLS